MTGLPPSGSVLECELFLCSFRERFMANARPLPLLVLDLDGTLLDAAPPGRRPGKPVFLDRGKEVRLRPGLGEFLSFCLSHFDVAVWTAAPAAYAEAMCAGIAAACCPAFPSSL
eukprot:5518500-Prymnesium_polylepis.1